MDRGSSKHSPRVDEQMAQEVLGHVQGSPDGGRAEEWREPEPPGEDQPEPSWIPEGDRRGGAPAPLTADDVEARSQLGRYLTHTIFPANRDAVRRAAQAAQAPDEVLAEIDQLPPEPEFGTVSAVWAALGHHNEEHRW